MFLLDASFSGVEVSDEFAITIKLVRLDCYSYWFPKTFTMVSKHILYLYFFKLDKRSVTLRRGCKCLFKIKIQ